MYSCSNGFNSVDLVIGHGIIDRALLVLLFKMCKAYEHWGLLCFMYLKYSLYL